jgi:hypothetical protein
MAPKVKVTKENGNNCWLSSRQPPEIAGNLNNTWQPVANSQADGALTGGGCTLGDSADGSCRPMEAYRQRVKQTQLDWKGVLYPPSLGPGLQQTGAQRLFKKTSQGDMGCRWEPASASEGLQ